MNYHFHARASGIPLFMTEALYQPLGYGMFDYYFLQEKDLLSGYYSDLGMQQMHDCAVKNFFEKAQRESVLNGIKKYDEKLRQLALSENYWNETSDISKRLQMLVNIRELAREFGTQYFIMEQPCLLALEEVVEKACEREGLSHDAVLHNPDIARDFLELEKILLETLIELGHLKLSVHARSESFMRSIYELLSCIATKEGLPLEHAQSMAYLDIEEYLKRGTLSRDILELRSRGVVFLPGSAAGQSQMMDGAMYTEWKGILESPLTGDIKGMVACRGKIQGKVTVHLEWMGVTEVPPGNILVTGMTNPQMIPYIKHAAGIVTDEGGLMCHAAIIAREMKIPCVVGTKIATQVLKDGDLVEVDADNGVVRIIEKAKL